MHEWASCRNEAANHQLPITVTFSITHIVPQGMFKLSTKFDADLLLYLLSHFECEGHTVHMFTQWCLPPHWLVKWSWYCSHMRIPVHSPWLPGYINVSQTVFTILTMAGLFLDRLAIHNATQWREVTDIENRLRLTLLPYYTIKILVWN